MVDSSKNSAKKQTPTPTSLDMSSIKISESKTKVASFVELQQALLAEHSLKQSKVNNPQLNAKEQKDTVDALIQQLKSAINEENSRKAQEIQEMKDMLANQEQ